MPTGKISFSSRISGNDEIYVVNADGTSSTPTQLTFDGGLDGAPCISPDGTKIVYTKWTTGTPSHKQLWVMNSDGSGQTLLDDPPAGSTSYTDDNPSWSADGTKIVFQSARTGWNLIYFINASVTGLTQVNNQPTGGDNIYPSFSPDGTKIIFGSLNGIKINTINLDGTSPTLLYTSSSQIYDAKFSPDGLSISYYLVSNSKIYIMDANGTNNALIATGAEPAWSPDGKFLIYNNGGIKIMDASGTLVSNLFTGNNDIAPSWGAGSAIVAGPATTQAVSGLPSPILTNTANTVTITAKDSIGITATGYTGTMHFTSSDSQSILPADYTFVTSDYGTHTFTGGVTLKTTGTQSIMVMDKETSSITGTQSNITVNTLSNDATLSNLTISTGTLAPVFAAGTITYTDNVANATSSITVTPTVNESHATVIVNGNPVTSGSPSSGIGLVVGANTITVVVTAQDTTTKTYTITVTRAVLTTTTTTTISLSNDAALSGLSLNSGTLAPAFNPGNVSYTTNAVSVTSAITITPTVNESHASVIVNNIYVTSGLPSSPISLNIGANTITVEVTAQDGTTTRTYTVIVTKLSGDATLSNLSISSGALTPAFAAGTTGYADNVANSISSVTVNPTANENHIVITVNGIPAANGATSGAISLSVGTNTITIVVTPQDVTISKTYSITVIRAAPPTTTTTGTTTTATTTTS